MFRKGPLPTAPIRYVPPLAGFSQDKQKLSSLRKTGPQAASTWDSPTTIVDASGKHVVSGQMASNPVRLSAKAARSLIFEALTGAGTLPANSGYFADAILDTELSGLEGHGFNWLQYYCEHVRGGKVDGKAVPKVTKLSPVAFRV